MSKKILKIVSVILVTYLIISSVYIFAHIDFGEPPEMVGQGFSESTNKIRIFLGLPQTFTTYEGVPPIYMISVIVRVLIAAILLIYIVRKGKSKK